MMRWQNFLRCGIQYCHWCTCYIFTMFSGILWVCVSSHSRSTSTSWIEKWVGFGSMYFHGQSIHKTKPFAIHIWISHVLFCNWCLTSSVRRRAARTFSGYNFENMGEFHKDTGIEFWAFWLRTGTVVVMLPCGSSADSLPFPCPRLRVSVASKQDKRSHKMHPRLARWWWNGTGPLQVTQWLEVSSSLAATAR